MWADINIRRLSETSDKTGKYSTVCMTNQIPETQRRKRQITELSSLKESQWPPNPILCKLFSSADSFVQEKSYPEDWYKSRDALTESGRSCLEPDPFWSHSLTASPPPPSSSYEGSREPQGSSEHSLKIALLTQPPPSTIRGHKAQRSYPTCLRLHSNPLIFLQQFFHDDAWVL